MQPKTNMTNSQWLNANENNPNLIVLFTQMHDPVSGTSASNLLGYIPNSIFFDFEKVFCVKDSSLPHTMPNEACFTEQAQKIGINRDSIIVIYDEKGIYSAPRVWWMFKSMGHDEVYVLDGGLPNWIDQKSPIQSQLTVAATHGDFKGKFSHDYFINANEIVQKLPSIQVLDARSVGRFNGSQQEPRKGLRSGHIPTAINLPFSQCVDDTKLRAKTELTEIFERLNLDSTKPLVFSCGSGVTACILALAAAEVGYSNLAVYDGSWSEWGASIDLPIEL